MTILYVSEISRISRSPLETLDVVRGLEEERGIIVWSLSAKEVDADDRSLHQESYVGNLFMGC